MPPGAPASCPGLALATSPKGGPPGGGGGGRSKHCGCRGGGNLGEPPTTRNVGLVPSGRSEVGTPNRPGGLPSAAGAPNKPPTAPCTGAGVVCCNCAAEAPKLPNGLLPLACANGAFCSARCASGCALANRLRNMLTSSLVRSTGTTLHWSTCRSMSHDRHACGSRHRRVEVCPIDFPELLLQRIQQRSAWLFCDDSHHCVCKARH